MLLGSNFRRIWQIITPTHKKNIGNWPADEDKACEEPVEVINKSKVLVFFLEPIIHREYSKTFLRHKTGLFSCQNSISAGAHNPERETSFESSGIKAFSRARLFLNRFWREFKTSFRSHKPESRVRSRRSDGGERVNSYAGKTRGDFPLVFFFLVNISPTLYDLNAWKRLALSCKNTAKTERGTWVRDERSARSSLSKITLKFYEGIGILFCRLTWYGLRQHL